MLLKRLTRKNFIPERSHPITCATRHKLPRILFYLYNLLEPILSIDDFQGPKYTNTHRNACSSIEN